MYKLNINPVVSFCKLDGANILGLGRWSQRDPGTVQGLINLLL